MQDHTDARTDARANAQTSGACRVHDTVLEAEADTLWASNCNEDTRNTPDDLQNTSERIGKQPQ